MPVIIKYEEQLHAGGKLLDALPPPTRNTEHMQKRVAPGRKMCGYCSTWRGEGVGGGRGRTKTKRK